MYKPKPIWKSIVISLFVITMLVVSFVFYTTTLYKTLSDERVMYLSEITNQASRYIKSEIKGNIKYLENIARIAELNKMNKADIIDNVKTTNTNTRYDGIGISDLNGNANMASGVSINISDREYYKKSIQGETYISNKLIGKNTNKEIIVYSAPVFENGKVKYIIFAYNYCDKYNEGLSIHSFGGSAYSCITDRDGNVILQSKYKHIDKDINNIFDNIKKSEHTDDEDISIMKNNLKSNIEGSIGYKYINMENILAYAPININDWYINIIIPEYIILGKLSNFVNITICLFTCLTIIFTTLLIYILVNNSTNSKRLYEIAFVDNLTKIGNYNYLRRKGKKFIEDDSLNNYIICLDIDKFKLINDRYGYEVGNKILIEIANVIANIFIKDSVYCRTCNDEFFIISKYDGNVESIERISEMLSDEISKITLSNNKNLDIKPSLGIYILNQEKENLDFCVDKATIAKSQIKGNRINKYVFYEEKLKSKLVEEKEIESDMKESLKDGEFELYLQPKFNINTDAIVSSEALVRWNHKEKGLISPGKFIPVFERNKFIRELDVFVFREVCKLISRWDKENKTIYPISVNVSRVSLENGNMQRLFEGIAKEYGVNYSYIQIEITESAIFENEEQFISIIDNLRHVGFKVSIDDFGSGYSSLNMLKNTSVDEIKLDKAFLTNSIDEAKNNIIVESIINMAHQLGLVIVAEGIETQKQKDYLKSIGCDIGQGYVFSKPIKITEYEDIIKKEYS